MNVKRVLGIVGSPRMGGNTESLVDAVLEGAQASGAIIEKVRLSELNIQACRACDGCNETRSCVIDDDLDGLKEKLAQSDAWVFGTPVYYSGPTTQFKAFMDRWYSIDQAIFKDKPVVLAIPLGDNRPEIARHTVGMFEDALEFQKSRILSTIVAPNVFEIGKLQNYPEILEQAHQAGVILAEFEVD